MARNFREKLNRELDLLCAPISNSGQAHRSPTMSRSIVPFVAFFLAVVDALAISQPASAGPVNATIYSGFVSSGDGSPFSNPVGTVSSPDASFYTDNGGNWHPFGLSALCADITGGINVPTTGSYTVQLGSDDGSQLFVDGISRLSLPGGHVYSATNVNLSLTAGVHSFEIHFFEAFGGQSGVDLLLSPSSSLSFVPLPSSVPEPSSLVLTLIGMTVCLAPFAARWPRKRSR